VFISPPTPTTTSKSSPIDHATGEPYGHGESVPPF